MDASTGAHAIYAKRMSTTWDTFNRILNINYLAYIFIVSFYYYYFYL